MRGLLPSRAALALNLALATVALMLAVGTPASQGGPRLELAGAEGSLSLSNSKDGVAIFSAGGMRPGDEAGGTVRIANTGSVPATLRLAPTAVVDTPGRGGGRLGSRLDLLILDVTVPQAPVTIFAGKPEQMVSEAAGAIGAGQSREYRFVSAISAGGPGDDAYQGARLVAGFTWTATGSQAATPSPTATATPTPSPTTQPPAAMPQPPTGSVHPPPDGGDADPTGAVLGAQVFSLPSGKRCVSRRAFRISLRRPKGIAFKSLKITVNRKAKVKLTGLKARRIGAWVNLRGLPRGRFTVQIVAVTTTGRKAVSKRTYRTCATRGALKPRLEQRRSR